MSAAATDGRVVTFRAALMGEVVGAGGEIRALFALLGGVCFRLESLPGVVEEAFLGGRPRFRGAGVSTAGGATLVADFGGLPRRLGVGVVVVVGVIGDLVEAFLGGLPRGRPVEVGLVADFGGGGLAAAAAAALGVATEDRLVL